MPAAAPEIEPEEQKSEFANPDSVNLQPDPQRVNEAGQGLFDRSGLGDDITRRVDTKEQAGLAPGAKQVQGDKPLFPAAEGIGKNSWNEAHSPNAKKEKKPNWLAKKLQNSREQTKESLGKIAAARAKAKAGELVKKEARRIIMAELTPLIIAALPTIIVVLLVLIVVFFVVLLIVGLVIQKKGDPPDKKFDVGISAGLKKTPSNPDGTYLKMMTDTLVVHDEKNVPRTLSVETTAGGFGEEATVTLGKDGKWCYPGSCLYFNDGFRLDSKTKTPLSDTEAKYYVTMRWPFMSKIVWPAGGHSFKPVEGLGKDYLYGGRRIIVYNKKTQKAVVGVAGEWGPAPAAGVCTFDGSKFLTTTVKNARNGDNSCEEEGTAWNDPSRQSANPTYVVPPDNFTGRILGAPKALADAIGLQTDDIVIVGFAVDQNVAPGTIYNITPDMLATAGSGKATSGKGLNVPGVAEGEEGQCGMASHTMTALYYVSKGNTVPLTLGGLPDALKAVLLPPDPNSNAMFKVNPSKSSSECTGPGFLNNLGGLVPKGWDFVHVDEGDKAKFLAAERSVKDGNPVIVYTAKGGMYTNSRHVYVLVGFDDATQEFIVNNPYPGGVDVGKLASEMPGNKPPQTIDHLFNFRGELDKGQSGWPKFGHTFVMLTKYLK